MLGTGGTAEAKEDNVLSSWSVPSLILGHDRNSSLTSQIRKVRLGKNQCFAGLSHQGLCFLRGPCTLQLTSVSSSVKMGSQIRGALGSLPHLRVSASGLESAGRTFPKGSCGPHLEESGGRGPALVCSGLGGVKGTALGPVTLLGGRPGPATWRKFSHPGINHRVLQKPACSDLLHRHCTHTWVQL